MKRDEVLSLLADQRISIDEAKLRLNESEREEEEEYERRLARAGFFGEDFGGRCCSCAEPLLEEESTRFWHEFDKWCTEYVDEHSRNPYVGVAALLRMGLVRPHDYPELAPAWTKVRPECNACQQFFRRQRSLKSQLENSEKSRQIAIMIAATIIFLLLLVIGMSG